MIEPISAGKFFASWLPALAVTATAVPGQRLADAWSLDLGGVSVPIVTAVLGALGVLVARPLARKSENALSWPMFALVSLIMLIVVELWVIDSRPGALFAFVVAIGLGFSGYSLIELVGTEIRNFITNLMGKAATLLPGTKDKGSDQ